MKRLLSSLNSSGLALLLVLSALDSNAGAENNNNNRSPLRGTWSWSEFVPATSGLGTASPVPTAAVGTFIMGDDNHFTGHAVVNVPLSLPPPELAALEADINGTCTFRGDVSNGMDCLVNIPSFGITNAGRYCVVMENRSGQCFDEFRCTNTSEAGGTVLLVEFKRQRPGTCK